MRLTEHAGRQMRYASSKKDRESMMHQGRIVQIKVAKQTYMILLFSKQIAAGNCCQWGTTKPPSTDSTWHREFAHFLLAAIIRRHHFQSANEFVYVCIGGTKSVSGVKRLPVKGFMNCECFWCKSCLALKVSG